MKNGVSRYSHVDDCLKHHDDGSMVEGEHANYYRGQDGNLQYSRATIHERITLRSLPLSPYPDSISNSERLLLWCRRR